MASAHNFTRYFYATHLKFSLEIAHDCTPKFSCYSAITSLRNFHSVPTTLHQIFHSNHSSLHSKILSCSLITSLKKIMTVAHDSTPQFLWRALITLPRNFYATRPCLHCKISRACLQLYTKFVIAIAHHFTQKNYGSRSQFYIKILMASAHNFTTKFSCYSSIISSQKFYSACPQLHSKTSITSITFMMLAHNFAPKFS